MSNTVYDVDFTRTLPAPLKNDENILALGRVISEQLHENIVLLHLNIIYPRIDELDENLLDILAYDLHIDWYDPDSTIDVKRSIIKNSVKVHKRMGTKFAVESVVQSYFGSGEVCEWYEYGGEPHHFKVLSNNASLTNEHINQFFRILGIIKRKSSWLDAVLITLTGEMTLNFGIVFKDTNRAIHLMGSQDYFTFYTGTILDEYTKEAHIMGSQDYIATYTGSMLDECTSESHIMGADDIRHVYMGMLFDEQTIEAHAIVSG